MSADLTQFNPREGMNVFGSDGDKVGEVDTVERDYFVVRKGFFFPEDHFIPRNAIANFDEENIYLQYTKDEVLAQDWPAEPDAGAWNTTTLAGTSVGDRRDDLVEVDSTSQPGRDPEMEARGVDAGELDHPVEHRTDTAHNEGVAVDVDEGDTPRR